MGSKDFSGAQALSQAYGQALEAKGYDINYKENIGATEIVYQALENGDLDAYADYQGTLLTYLGGTASGDSATNYKALLAKLKGTGIVASKAAPAVDVNGFYVTKATAKKYKLKTMTDLAKVIQQAHLRWAARVPGPAALPRRHLSEALRLQVLGRVEARSRADRSRCRRSKTATSTWGSSSPAAA